MASCWRELATREGVSLHVIAHQPSGSGDFDSRLLDDVPHRYLDAREAEDIGLVNRLVAETSPDIVAMTGWWLRPYRSLLVAANLSNAKFVMGIDSPWWSELQYLNRLRYGQYLPHVDHFYVAGERSWQYMKKMGIAGDRISRGMYGVDVARWTEVHRQRSGRPWPRRFLFLGRYAPVKALDVLVPAYRRYRESVADAWELWCCGKGPNAHLLAGVEGITDKGFVQPADLPVVFAECGTLVMPSRFDPWPLALVEGCASGLPIICSDACGSAVENVRPLYNGLIVASESVAELTQAMLTIHRAEEHLPEWGSRSHNLAQAYSAELWADRWLNTCQRLVGASKQSA